MSGFLGRLWDEILHPLRGVEVRSMAAEFGPTIATRHAEIVATMTDAELMAFTPRELAALLDGRASVARVRAALAVLAADHADDRADTERRLRAWQRAGHLSADEVGEILAHFPRSVTA